MSAREPEMVELDWSPYVTKDELRGFYDIQPFRIAIDAAMIWGVILATFWLWSRIDGIWAVAAWPICALVIGARQHALNNAVHDGAHFSFSRNKALNDAISDVFFAGPHFISTDGYRRKHIPHHTDLGDPSKDVEFKARYIISHGRLWSRLLKTLLGETAWRTARQYATPGAPSASRTLFRVFCVGATNAALFAYCWALGAPAAYFHLWMLPLFTVTSLLATIRVIAEHQPVVYAEYGVENWDTTLRPAITRSIGAGPVSRFFLAPMNFCYHLEHHIWPSVPYTQLPRLSKLLRERGFYDRHASLWASSYAGVLRKLVDARRPPSEGNSSARQVAE